MLNLKQKISKRVHPWPLTKYEFKKNKHGLRKFKVAEKYGQPINCCKADHIHIYMTLRCHLNCYFCINKLAVDRMFEYKEMPLQEWSQVLNKFHNVKELYFNGGEHFILNGFADFINSLEGFNIRMFTSFPKGKEKEFKKLDPERNNILILMSYHPTSGEPAVNFIERLNGNIPKGILCNPHIIESKGVSTRMYRDVFNRYGYYPTKEELVLPFMNKAKTRPVLCKTNEFMIAPDMRLFNCLIHLLRGDREHGKTQYKFNTSIVRCSDYPRCAGCSAYNEIVEYL